MADYKFKKGDIVTYEWDDPKDEVEWGTVTSDQEDDHGVYLIWNDPVYATEVPVWEDPQSLKLVFPAPDTKFVDSKPSIVSEALAEKAGHPGEGDKGIDMVNNPPHYNQHPKGIECIDIIEDNPFILLGNAMKYLWRVSWGGKGNDVEDLNKAIWYIQRELKRRERG